MTIFVAVLQWSLLLAYETTTTQPAPPLDNGFRRARLPQLRSSSRHKNVPQPLQGLLNPYPPGCTSTMCTQETLPTLRQAYAPTRPGYCYPPHEEIYKIFLRHPCSTREKLSGSFPFSSLPLLFQLSRLFPLIFFFYLSHGGNEAALPGNVPAKGELPPSPMSLALPPSDRKHPPSDCCSDWPSGGCCCCCCSCKQ